MIKPPDKPGPSIFLPKQPKRTPMTSGCNVSRLSVTSSVTSSVTAVCQFLSRRRAGDPVAAGCRLKSTNPKAAGWGMQCCIAVNLSRGPKTGCRCFLWFSDEKKQGHQSLWVGIPRTAHFPRRRLQELARYRKEAPD